MTTHSEMPVTEVPGVEALVAPLDEGVVAPEPVNPIDAALSSIREQVAGIYIDDDLIALGTTLSNCGIGPDEIARLRRANAWLGELVCTCQMHQIKPNWRT